MEGRIKSQTPITDVETEVITKAQNLRKSAGFAMCGIFTAMFLSAPAVFAAGDLTGNITTALTTIINALVTIAIPVYVLTAVICLIMIVASSGRKAEMAKDWLIRATIGIIAIGMIKAIESFIKSFGSFTY